MLPHFDNIQAAQMHGEPIRKSLFELSFGNIENQKILQEQVSGYQMLAPQDSEKKYLRIDFQLMEDDMEMFIDTIRLVNQITLKLHSRQGTVFAALEFPRIREERFTLEGNYLSSELQTISYYWEYQETEWLTCED